MNEIIVFGGTFNPPTHAHVEIMQYCLEQPSVDEVWVMPSKERVDKDITVATATRLAMLETIQHDTFGGSEKLRVSDFEARLPGPTETYNTVLALNEAYPDKRFRFLFGVDAYQSMPTWRHGDELQRNLPMLLLPRDGVVPPRAPNVHVLPPLRHVGLSSTEARQADPLELELFVPSAIARFVRKHRLYEPLTEVQ